MIRPILLLAAVLATAALAAGCGGDDDSSGGGAASDGASAPVATTKVSMENLKFDPAAITVKVGQTVTWTNDESIPHNVVSMDGADFKSDTFGEGGTYEFTPKEAGLVKYECTLHPGMLGSIEVT
ncbi:MAG: hypothetical protein HZB46_15990 [Solirubrobacterales bacterium]|nr:hypothetical protein [Solirubrobacterales bacterium]